MPELIEDQNGIPLLQLDPSNEESALVLDKNGEISFMQTLPIDADSSIVSAHHRLIEGICKALEHPEMFHELRELAERALGESDPADQKWNVSKGPTLQ